MEKEKTISQYIIKYELDIEKMIKDFSAYIHTIIDNNSKGQLSYEDKEEIMSDVFLTVWHNKSKIDSSKPLKNYIAGITKNLIKNKFRNYKNITNEIYIDEIEVQDLNNIDIICEQDEIKEVIKKELNNMNPDEYKIFAQYYYFQKSIKDIARELKLTETNVKVKLYRIRKKLKKRLQNRGIIYRMLSIIMIFCIITGIVYATVIISSKIQQHETAEPIKWAYSNIEIKASEEKIMEYMKQYNENTYMLYLNDAQIFDKSMNDLQITFKDNDNGRSEIVNKDTFEKYNYDVILVVFLGQKDIIPKNVLPYRNKLTLEFTFNQENIEEDSKIAYFICIPKQYNRDVKEIIYEKEQIATSPEAPPEGAVTFKTTAFYIENIEEFENLDLTYDNEQKIYCTKYMNAEQYNELADRLGIVTENEVTEERIKNSQIFLVFKKTSNKINFRRFKVEDDTPYIYLEQTEGQYGDGITGRVVIIDSPDTPYTSYKVFI